MNYVDYQGSRYVGMDLGDRKSHISYLTASTGELIEEVIATTGPGMTSFFSDLPKSLVAIEVGAHSFWISNLIESFGHTVVIANPRQVFLISKSHRKNDRADAELLRKLVAADPTLLCPITHRRMQAQIDLTLIKARDGLIRSRTLLTNQAKTLIKPFGLRLTKSTISTLRKEASEVLPMELVPTILSLLTAAEAIGMEVKLLEKRLEEIAQKRYPQVRILQEIQGVGPITAMAYALTIDDPKRFRRSRTVGAYLGLVPRQSESGQNSPQLGITKRGNGYLRTLLVNCAQRMLGVFGVDCELRRWGLERASRGGGNAKKRAVIGVARKLAVIMHRMWISGEKYQPFHKQELASTSVS